MVTRGKPRKTSSAQDARTTTMPPWPVFWPLGQTPAGVIMQLTNTNTAHWIPIFLQRPLFHSRYAILATFLRCYKIYGN